MTTRLLELVLNIENEMETLLPLLTLLMTHEQSALFDLTPLPIMFPDSAAAADGQKQLPKHATVAIDLLPVLLYFPAMQAASNFAWVVCWISETPGPKPGGGAVL